MLPVVEVQELVDTGAQASLVRSNLLPSGSMRLSKKPLLLRTASGEELQGGKHEATLRLEFPDHSEDGRAHQEPLKMYITVHHGDIGCDIIIGYP